MRALFFFLVILAFTPAAYAEDMGSLEHRTQLAAKMHELRPARDQVYDAIDAIAERQSPANREEFRAAMKNALDYRAIEKVSTDAMAETFSEAELQAMVDYYTKPEAVSAGKKEDDYRAKLMPEIIRMLDVAMMRVRTGQ